MKRTYLFFVVLFFALFFSLNKVEAQIGSGLDTLTKINGYRLISYAAGVTYAKTWFTNIDPFHGKFSQFFEVDRNYPDVADDRKYFAIFEKKLPKRIKKSDYLRYSYNYSHSKPQISTYGETPIMDIAFGNNGNISNFKNLIADKRDNWTTYPVLVPFASDSIDCVYLRVSGSFKETAIQIDYLVFADPIYGTIFDVIDDFEDSTIVDVQKEVEFPTSYSLSQNYPNPFNPSTTITFQLSKSNFVSLKVFDVLGREVAVLVNEEKSVGEYSVRFDGSHLASGMYIYQINIGHGQFVQTKKMILVK